MSDQSQSTQTTLEQDLKRYEDFCDPDVLVDVVDDSCDLLHKFVGHAIRLKQQNEEARRLLTTLRISLVELRDWHSFSAFVRALIQYRINDIDNVLVSLSRTEKT